MIFFVTLLHGLTPRLGVYVMNVSNLLSSFEHASEDTVQGLSVIKIIILVFVVITGWVVLSGRTRIADPHVNFRNAFAGSSHSSNDVIRTLLVFELFSPNLV